MSNDRITSLSCWQNEISYRPLAGGITNQNYLVRDGATSFVVRICEDRRFLGIDRNNERVCQQAAYQTDVAPEVVHCEEGMLVSRYIEANPISNEALADMVMLERLALTLRRLHQSRDELTGEMLFFCPFQTVRTYTATARRIGAELPSNMDSLLEESRRLSHQIRYYVPTLCHNDLLAANILDDGSKLWLVDWEYAGIGNPLFDLASVCANCRLTPELEIQFLEMYSGASSPQEMRTIGILKTVSLLREALWAVIQTVKSDLDFDYRKYAADNFEAYQQAREKL